MLSERTLFSQILNLSYFGLKHTYSRHKLQFACYAELNTKWEINIAIKVYDVLLIKAEILLS